MNDVVNEAIARAAPGFRPRVAVILGSGLGGFADEVAQVATFPYADLPGFPPTTVGSHAGCLVLGHVGPTPVAVLQGRAHYYERGRADEMRAAIRAGTEIQALALTTETSRAAFSQFRESVTKGLNARDAAFSDYRTVKKNR